MKESHPHALPKGKLDAHGGWGHNPGFEGYGPICMITGQGALAFATASERFERYAAAMAADAAPHAGTRRWTRHWGADVEATALAEALNVAVVCVETADRSNPTDDRSRRTEPKMYLGVPSAFAEREGDETRTHSTNQRRTNQRRTSERLRLGRYLPRGRLLDGGPPASAGAGEKKMKLGAAGSFARAAWTSARGGVRLTVALVPASERRRTWWAIDMPMMPPPMMTMSALSSVMTAC